MVTVILSVAKNLGRFETLSPDNEQFVMIPVILRVAKNLGRFETLSPPND